MSEGVQTMTKLEQSVLRCSCGGDASLVETYTRGWVVACGDCSETSGGKENPIDAVIEWNEQVWNELVAEIDRLNGELARRKTSSSPSWGDRML